MTNLNDIVTNYFAVLEKCPIFEGLSPQRFQHVLTCLNAYVRHYCKGEQINQSDISGQTAGILLEGTAGISLPDENGNLVRIKHLSPSDLFGVEHACGASGSEWITLEAITDCEFLFVNLKNLMSMGDVQCENRTMVTVNLLRELAAETQFLNTKIRILSQKYLRDRLKVYLQSLDIQSDGTIKLPFSRQELAEYLYADRSALSRELSRMRDEGLIEYNGRFLTILDRDFLEE